MSYISIASKLAAILETVKTAGGSKLASYYTYENPTSDTTPFAQIITKDSEEIPLDTSRNQTTYKYVIRCIDINKDKENMETTMRTLADAILAEMRKSTHETLDNDVVRFSPFKINWGWDTANQMPLRFFDIEIEAVGLFTK